MKPFVSVVIPAFNEECAIGDVVRDVRRVLSAYTWSYEVLVVDDGSIDHTATVAKSAGAVVISRRSRGGSGTARKFGIERSSGRIIAMIDADGSYDASDIPVLLKALETQGLEQVIGMRKCERGRWPRLRGFAKWCVRMLAVFLSRTSIPDLNSGLRVFNKAQMEQYLWSLPDGFSCVSTMTLTFLFNGHSVGWVPVEYRSRVGVSKFHPFNDTYAYILTVIRLVIYFHPLRVIFPLSAFVVAIGIIKSLVDFFWLVGKLQLSDVVIILGGFLIGVLGLLADLVVAKSRQMNYLIQHLIERS